MIDPCHIWSVIYNARTNSQPHQILLLPRKMILMIDPCNIWNVNLQCAEQQVSLTNLTKYCACHEEWFSRLILVAYETSFTMRGATGVIPCASEKPCLKSSKFGRSSKIELPSSASWTLQAALLGLLSSASWNKTCLAKWLNLCFILGCFLPICSPSPHIMQFLFFLAWTFDCWKLFGLSQPLTGFLNTCLNSLWLEYIAFDTGIIILEKPVASFYHPLLLDAARSMLKKLSSFVHLSKILSDSWWGLEFALLAFLNQRVWIL